MKIETEYIKFDTLGNSDIINITPRVDEVLKRTGLNTGCATIFVPGATGALTTIEYEAGLIKDLQDALDRLAPEEMEYRHDLKWGDGNGHSHIRASLLGPGITIPFTGGRLILGTWQQIIFIDMDNRPRNRKLVVQIIGQ